MDSMILMLLYISQSFHLENLLPFIIKSFALILFLYLFDLYELCKLIHSIILTLADQRHIPQPNRRMNTKTAGFSE